MKTLYLTTEKITIDIPIKYEANGKQKFRELTKTGLVICSCHLIDFVLITSPRNCFNLMGTAEGMSSSYDRHHKFLKLI